MSPSTPWSVLSPPEPKVSEFRALNLSSSFFSPRSTLLVGRCQRCQRCRDGRGGERVLGSLTEGPRLGASSTEGGFFLFFSFFVIMTSLLVLNVLNCHLRTPNQTLLYSRFQIWGRGRAAVVTHGTMVRNRRIELKGESPSTRLSPSERGLMMDCQGPRCLAGPVCHIMSCHVMTSYEYPNPSTVLVTVVPPCFWGQGFGFNVVSTGRRVTKEV